MNILNSKKNLNDSNIKDNSNNNLKTIANENWLSQLNNKEKISLENYLYALNPNINWYIIIEKHLTTTNEKFIKQIKSLIWEEHPSGILTEENYEDNYSLLNGVKLKNTFDHISNLFDILNFDQRKIKILKPDLTQNLPDVIKEYYKKIMVDYELFFKIFQIKYEYISQEEDKCLLLGQITKNIIYNKTMFLDYSFPINYHFSEVYNNLIMAIFVNINSDVFDFNSYKYYFINISNS